LNSNPTHFIYFTFIFVSCEESCLLVSWCADGRCDMVGSDEDRGRSRRPGAKDRRWLGIGQVLNGRTIRRSSDTMCGLHHTREDKERGFLD
jgi:hypothetical protein